MQTVLYKRATFVTHLPVEHLFTPSHSWLSQIQDPSGQPSPLSPPKRWRVGYTKFALRMLGEIVDVQVEMQPGGVIAPGDIVGNIEGFKALSDLYAVGTGKFVRANPELGANLEQLSAKPYDAGWIYEFEGEPDGRAMDVNGYRNLLDATIDRMLQKEQESKASHE
jgi:glycine cleavage system H protein